MKEIQARRFDREWKNVEPFISTDNADINHSSDEIGSFLALADLSNFEARFVSEGVGKTSHLTDVTVEDLILIGMLYVHDNSSTY